jgi:hypothetical protein
VRKTLPKFARFEIVAAIIIAAMVMLIVHVHVPYAVRLFHEGRDLWLLWGFKQQATDIAVQKKRVERDNFLLDSLIAAGENSSHADANSVMAALYKCTDSVGLKTSKVEIGERMRITDHFETSVTVRGSGGYASVGRFCEAIENMPAPVRIRQITANGASGGSVDAIIDFMVLTQ